jgi:hypothetical protein
MATGGLYGSTSTGTVAPQSGSESVGLYGNNTVFGGSYFEWFIFQVVETAPATPTGGSWNFATNTGTPPAGWLGSPPPTPTTTVWVSVGLVNSKSTSSIIWSVPGKFSYAVGLPILSGSAVPSGIGQADQLYIQTSTAPYSIWFNSAGTWTKMTGSSLYADLISNQTLAGVKTFSSTIQGSISGNAATATNVPYSGLTGTVPTWNQNTTGTAANVTGTVAIANGGTGGTTAADARTNLGVTATGVDTTYAYRANNLSDLASASTARTNLGLGSAAVLTAGSANGVATLDSGGTVPLSQIPASIQGGVSYQGAWNASTNSPTLTSSVGTKGYYYVVSTAGSTNLNGVTDWNIGDWAIFNGSAWQKIDNTDLVTSVNGLTGTVVLNAANVGAVGTIASADGSIIVTTVGAAVDLSVSQTSPASVLVEQVRNTTGATLTKGTAVYISGATGQIPTVSKALATSDATSAQTLGLITTDLANNSNGFVTITGLVANINTSAYTDGAQLYLSPITAGTLTATKPYAPQHLVYMAIVAHAHPTQGKLIVSVQNGYEMDELHNVSAQSPSNGQTLVYNTTTSLWEKSFAPILSSATGLPLATGVTGTLPIANGGTNATATPTAGAVPYGTGTAYAFSAAGTSGQVLTSAGTGTPTWTTPTTGTVTSVTGTSPVVSSGGTTPAISMPAATTSVSGYLTSTDWNTFNGKGSGTVTSVTGTAPVVSSGGATPAISMAAATTSVSGYLTSTDWTTFNNKQAAGTYVTSVTGTSPIASSGGTTPAISLNASYGDTQNPYASKTANYVLAAPNGTAGVPTFRSIVAADIPTLNQNTTGTAANVTGTVAIANGGTGTATPSIVAGSNITVTGTWPNQTIASSGGSGGITTGKSIAMAMIFGF